MTHINNDDFLDGFILHIYLYVGGWRLKKRHCGVFINYFFYFISMTKGKSFVFFFLLHFIIHLFWYPRVVCLLVGRTLKYIHTYIYRDVHTYLLWFCVVHLRARIIHVRAHFLLKNQYSTTWASYQLIWDPSIISKNNLSFSLFIILFIYFNLSRILIYLSRRNCVTFASHPLTFRQ